MKDRIEAAIKDAYYSARDNGGTMHTAASDATDAVLAVLAAPDEATWKRLAAAVDDQLGGDTYVDRHGGTGIAFPDYFGERAAGAILAALAGTSAQARHTADDAAGGGEHG